VGGGTGQQGGTQVCLPIPDRERVSGRSGRGRFAAAAGCNEGAAPHFTTAAIAGCAAAAAAAASYAHLRQPRHATSPHLLQLLLMSTSMTRLPTSPLLLLCSCPHAAAKALNSHPDIPCPLCYHAPRMLLLAGALTVDVAAPQLQGAADDSGVADLVGAQAHERDAAPIVHEHCPRLGHHRWPGCCCCCGCCCRTSAPGGGAVPCAGARLHEVHGDTQSGGERMCCRRLQARAAVLATHRTHRRCCVCVAPARLRLIAAVSVGICRGSTALSC
jgi:hypothetical protein